MRPAWIRWTVRIGLGLFAAFAALVGLATYRVGLQTTLLVASVILQPLIATTKPPAILAGQIGDGPFGGDLTPFLRQRFPLGTNETVITTTLLRQGFRLPKPPSACGPPAGQVILPCPVRQPSRTLEYEWSQFPCGDKATVWWTVGDHGAITDIGGRHSRVCL
jgi:hypothetical protein